MSESNELATNFTPPPLEAPPEAVLQPEVSADDDAGGLLNILCVRNLVLFPGVVLPISIGRKRSIEAVQDAVRGERQRPIGILLQKDQETESPSPADLYSVGTVAEVLRYITAPDGSHHIICQGQQRFRITEFVQTDPFLAARVERHEEKEGLTKEIEARFLTLKQQAREALQLLPQVPQELEGIFQAIESPSGLADMVATYMDLGVAEKQEILETYDVQARLDRVSRLLAHRLEVLRLSRDITQQTRGSLEKAQKDYFLREQMKTIQKELGETDAKSVEIKELSEAIAKARMPAEVEKEARKELVRLERMPEAAAEYAMIRTYLDWLIELPWSTATTDNLDIARARRVLDEDHYGLKKVKQRILEFLAARKLKPEGKSAILCLVGPPGVGKTSIGQSVARAMNRKFVRISLGGVHDEAEIRGHRRTYIGALPGTVVQSMRKAGSRNPVFMLDEVDKLSASFQGDPASALLEVLDPEQNSTFRDNYLGVPFDLSQVMFISTANVLDSIPGPLRDRCEVIEMPGYTEEEKLQIAKRFLVRRRMEQNGLTPSYCEITDEALRDVIRFYTREAGCRNLEREIGAICRRVATRLAEALDVQEAREAATAGPPGGAAASVTAPASDNAPPPEDKGPRGGEGEHPGTRAQTPGAPDLPPSGSEPPQEAPAAEHGPEAGGKSVEGKPAGGAPAAGSPLSKLDAAAAGLTLPVTVGTEELHGILGPHKFEGESALRTSIPGVATGLAWTPSGGDILFVEATKMHGKGNLILTGQLGDVMKESAQAAISLVKTRATDLGLDPTAFERMDIHIHVPAGAIPKDGPSAGVTIYTALVSLFTGRTVKSSIAMTGEISLRGLVLPVGGIKEKVLAAHSAGLTKVLLPARNKKDIEEVPASARETLELVWLENVDEATANALDPVPPGKLTPG